MPRTQRKELRDWVPLQLVIATLTQLQLHPLDAEQALSQATESKLLRGIGAHPKLKPIKFVRLLEAKADSRGQGQQLQTKEPTKGLIQDHDKPRTITRLPKEKDLGLGHRNGTESDGRLKLQNQKSK